MMTSYFIYGAIALKYIEVETVTPIFFTLGALGNLGGSFMVAATFTVLAKNFKEARPAVVCIAKSWVGVATGVATALYTGFFPGDDDSEQRLYFLFFIGGVGGLVPILISPILRPLPEDRPTQPDRFIFPQSLRLMYAYGVSAVLIIVTLLSTFFKQNAGVSVVLIVLLLIPFVIIIPRCSDRGYDGAGTEVAPLSNSPVEVSGGSEEAPARPGVCNFGSSAISLADSPWESGPAGMMRRPDFALLWLSALFLQSGGIFLTTNLGSMVQSRTGPAVTAATATTIFSCLQGFARLVTGNISNILLKNGYPRTAYFPMMMVLMCVGNLVLCIPGPVGLCLGTALCAWAFGSVYPLLVLSITEVFGKARFSSNYMIFDGTPGAIGSLFFAKFMAQSIYDAHTVEGDTKCHGDECFMLSHVIMAISSFVGCVVSCILAKRTSELYRKILDEGEAQKVTADVQDKGRAAP